MSEPRTHLDHGDRCSKADVFIVPHQEHFFLEICWECRRYYSFYWRPGPLRDGDLPATVTGYVAIDGKTFLRPPGDTALVKTLKDWIRECRWLQSIHSEDREGAQDWFSFWTKRKDEKLLLLKRHITAEEYAAFLEELQAP